MAINLSDKLTADHSENYIMSIRLRSGGLSFSAYSPSVSESFFYRDVEFDRTRPYISSLKDQRVAASKVLSGPQAQPAGDKAEFIEKVRRALYLGKIVSYAQGFSQLRAASED